MNASSSRTVFWHMSMISSRTLLVRQSRSRVKAWNSLMMPSQWRLSSRTLQLMIWPMPFILLKRGKFITWSVRDESLHCEGITKLFHAFTQERQCLTKAVRDDIMDVCQKTVRLEDAFIDLAFEQGPVEGMTPKAIKKYIRYIADWRLGQLGLKPIYMIDEHPLPWLAPLLNGVEHANFFETRATEYSKGATKGNWNDVWDSFDKRQTAKGAANDVPEVESEGEDMFGHAGVAAE